MHTMLLFVYENDISRFNSKTIFHQMHNVMEGFNIAESGEARRENNHVII